MGASVCQRYRPIFCRSSLTFEELALALANVAFKVFIQSISNGANIPVSTLTTPAVNCVKGRVKLVKSQVSNRTIGKHSIPNRETETIDMAMAPIMPIHRHLLL